MRLLIILSLLPTLILAQPDSVWYSGYVFQNGKYYLEDSASGNAIIQQEITNGISQLDNINNGYLTGDSLEINGQWWGSLFAVANFADTTFNLIEDHVLNSDSTELLPRRLTRVVIYNTPITGVERTQAYLDFNVPFEPTENTVVIDSSGNGDYTSIFSAIAAMNDFDTAIIKKGTYLEASNPFYLESNLTLITVGNASLFNDWTTYTFYLSGNNNKVVGLELEGRNTTGAGTFINGRDDNLFENCVFTDHTTRGIIINSNSNPYDFTINNSLFNSSYSGYGLEVTNSTINANGNYFNGSMQSALRASKSVDNIYETNFKYNKFNATSSNATVLLSDNRINNIKYNSIEADSLLNIITGITTTDTQAINVVGNDYNIRVTASEAGFLARTDEAVYNIENNTIVIEEGVSKPLKLTVDFSTNILGNNITINSGDGVNIVTRGTAKDRDTITHTFSGNTISILDPFDNSGNTGANLESETEEIIFEGTWICDSNNIYGGYAFSATFGGHGGLYLHNVRNRFVRYNYFKGHAIGGIIDKGITGTTEGVLATGYASYNIFDSTSYLIKGVSNSKVYNNTFHNAVNHMLDIKTNIDAAPNEKAEGTDIRNNIFYKEAPNGFASVSFEQDEDTTGISITNNIYNPTDTITVGGVEFSLSEWQSLGYDQNSYNTNPNFKSSSELWPIQPSDAIGKGLDLGSPYNIGLDITSVWPDSVVTTPQLSSWSIGAYVVPLGKKIVESDLKLIRTSNGQLIYFNK